MKERKERSEGGCKPSFHTTRLKNKHLKFNCVNHRSLFSFTVLRVSGTIKSVFTVCNHKKTRRKQVQKGKGKEKMQKCKNAKMQKCKNGKNGKNGKKGQKGQKEKEMGGILDKES
jgi:hypothetical protein